MDRFDASDDGLYDGGGEVMPIPRDEALRDRPRGSSGMLPFRLSLDPPSVRRDIIRCRRPERVFDDSKEITLAFILGLYAGSSGGPASRNAIRSCAAFDTCGVRGEEGTASRRGVLGLRMGVGMGTETGCGTTSTSALANASSLSDPFMMSSKSNDSLFLPILRVFFAAPWPSGGGIAFCAPGLLLDFVLVFRVIPSSWRGWGTFEIEMERRRCSAARTIVGLG